MRTAISVPVTSRARIIVMVTERAKYRKQSIKPDASTRYQNRPLTVQIPTGATTTTPITADPGRATAAAVFHTRGRQEQHAQPTGESDPVPPPIRHKSFEPQMSMRSSKFHHNLLQVIRSAPSRVFSHITVFAQGSRSRRTCAVTFTTTAVGLVAAVAWAA